MEQISPKWQNIFNTSNGYLALLSLQVIDFQENSFIFVDIHRGKYNVLDVTVVHRFLELFTPNNPKVSVTWWMLFMLLTFLLLLEYLSACYRMFLTKVDVLKIIHTVIYS